MLQILYVQLNAITLNSAQRFVLHVFMHAYATICDSIQLYPMPCNSMVSPCPCTSVQPNSTYCNSTQPHSVCNSWNSILYKSIHAMQSYATLCTYMLHACLCNSVQLLRNSAQLHSRCNCTRLNAVPCNSIQLYVA